MTCQQLAESFTATFPQMTQNGHPNALTSTLGSPLNLSGAVIGNLRGVSCLPLFAFAMISMNCFISAYCAGVKAGLFAACSCGTG